MRIHRTTYFKIIAVALSVLIPLFVIDIFMRADKDVSDKNTYNALNDSINKANKAFADKNPYGFTDSVRTEEKPEGVFRVAVTGDSFIWGDGLPWPKVWSHKLESKINARYNHVETLSWGKNGWSTLDEYNFFVTNGYRYHPDLLLFGFVHNDPDMGDYKHMNPLWYSRLGFMYKIFPRLTGTVLDYLYNGSYARWMKKLYSEKNLKKYASLLSDIKALEKKHRLKVAFVLTPNSIHDDNKVLFPQIDSLLKDADITCINLLPQMQTTFADTPPDSLKANPANSHPGDLLTEFYADEVLKYITENNLIDSTYLKKP